MQENFTLYKYIDSNGEFDYDEYRKIQIAGNKRKIRLTWVKRENIFFLSDYILKNMRKVNFGICHGTRRGKEQAWFKEYLDCDVLGTEISDTAKNFPNTIQWDFHEVKPEWIGAADFVYSNALDHSYDPEKCINAWMKCLKPNGMCIIEHGSAQEKTTKLDPFGAKAWVMPYLILKWGKGKFCVQDIAEPPFEKKRKCTQNFIIKNVERS